MSDVADEIVAKEQLSFINPKGREAIRDYMHKEKEGIFVPVCGGQVTVYKDEGFYDSAKRSYQYYLKPEEVYALILYPSLCTPIVLAPGDPLTVFYLINDAQMRNIHAGVMHKHPHPTAYAVGEIFAYNMWIQLHVSHWKHRTQYNPTPEFKIHYQTYFPLYEKRHDALGNMIFSEPVNLEPNPSEPLPLIDIDGLIMGQIKPAAAKMYYDNGYRHLIRVTHENHVMTEPGLYNLAFLSMEKRDTLLNNPGPFSPFQDDHDNLLKMSLNNFRTNIHHKYHVPKTGPFPFTLDKTDPIQAYHPVYVVDKPKLGVGHLTDVHVCSRHHGFQKCDLQVIPGAPESLSPPIGKLVNASYDALKDLMDQMGSHPGIDLLFVTGDLVDYSLNWDLTDQLGSVQDYEAIWRKMKISKYFKTGALETEKAYYQEHRKKSNFFTSNTLNPQNDLELHHTHGIDMSITYSLFIYYYDTYQKPIFLTSGNHDSYGAPFGISPRLKVRVDDVDLTNVGIKANKGIPMDHNLTFYEAILMFGKEYGMVLNAIKKPNFDPYYSNFLFQILTPLCDFSFTYRQQTFTGLEWGDDETIAQPIIFNGGTLPRAVTTMNDGQLKIMSQAVIRHETLNGSNTKNGFHFLFTHATLINFNTEIPFLTKRGNLFTYVVSLVNGLNSMCMSEYNEGSFVGNQYQLFLDYILNSRITHTFSGHSHRSALYECVFYTQTLAPQFPIPFVNVGPFLSIRVQGYPIDSTIIPKTYLKATNAYQQFLNGDKTKVIVTGSGGPIPCQNIIGEMANMGIVPPSGTILYYDELGKENIESLIARTPQAKPRFAVALDAMEIIAKKPPITIEGYFIDNFNKLSTNVTLKADRSLPPPEWIKSIRFIVIGKDDQQDDCEQNIEDIKIDVLKKTQSPEEIFTNFDYQNLNNSDKKQTPKLREYNIKHTHVYKASHELQLSFQNDFLLQIKEQTEIPGFLCIDFNRIEDPLYVQYDFNSTWIICASAYLEPPEEDNKAIQLMRIRRDPTFGEVPNFEFYSA